MAAAAGRRLGAESLGAGGGGGGREVVEGVVAVRTVMGTGPLVVRDADDGDAAAAPPSAAAAWDVAADGCVAAVAAVAVVASAAVGDDQRVRSPSAGRERPAA